MTKITVNKDYHLQGWTVVSVILLASLSIYTILRNNWPLGLVIAIQAFFLLISHKRDSKRRIVEVRFNEGMIEVDRINGERRSIPQSSIEDCRRSRNSLSVLYRKNEEILEHEFRRKDFDHESWTRLNENVLMSNKQSPSKA